MQTDRSRFKERPQLAHKLKIKCTLRVSNRAWRTFKLYHLEVALCDFMEYRTLVYTVLDHLYTHPLDAFLVPSVVAARKNRTIRKPFPYWDYKTGLYVGVEERMYRAGNVISVRVIDHLPEYTTFRAIEELENEIPIWAVLPEEKQPVFELTDEDLWSY